MCYKWSNPSTLMVASLRPQASMMEEHQLHGLQFAAQVAGHAKGCPPTGIVPSTCSASFCIMRKVRKRLGPRILYHSRLLRLLHADLRKVLQVRRGGQLLLDELLPPTSANSRQSQELMGLWDYPTFLSCGRNACESLASQISTGKHCCPALCLGGKMLALAAIYLLMIAAADACSSSIQESSIYPELWL